VVSGNASIAAPSGADLGINQSSSKAIVNWGTFSIGQGYGVTFNNGAGSMLNRVVGNVPSRIDGALTATGSVYLVNPAGVAVGSTGRIATGGSVIASTSTSPTKTASPAVT
jgi:filamentous hemagglutinin family protein